MSILYILACIAVGLFAGWWMSRRDQRLHRHVASFALVQPPYIPSSAYTGSVIRETVPLPGNREESDCSLAERAQAAKAKGMIGKEATKKLMDAALNDPQRFVGPSGLTTDHFGL